MKTTVSDSFFKRWCPDPCRLYDLGEIYATLNAKFFSGELPVLASVEQKNKAGEKVVKYLGVKWEGRFRKVLGDYTPNGKGTGGIRISRVVANHRNQVYSTLLHEMVHKLIDLKGLGGPEGDGVKGHGPCFIDTARVINAQCELEKLPYRVNFYGLEVTKPQPEVYSNLLKTTVFCGRDLDVARKVQSVVKAAFPEGSYDYAQ